MGSQLVAVTQASAGSNLVADVEQMAAEEPEQILDRALAQLLDAVQVLLVGEGEAEEALR